MVKGVRSGVLRGSVLETLLLLVFTDDQDKDIKSNILKFADDTKIFNKVRNGRNCSLLQSDLDKLFSVGKEMATGY